VRRIDDCLGAEGKGVAETAARMVQGKALHQDTADLLAPVIEVIRIDLRPQRSEPDREVIRFHLAGQELVETIVAWLCAVNPEMVSRHVRRTKEGKALNVVPVRVTEEKVPVEGSFSTVQQVGAQFADSRTGVANEQVITESDFDAGRVAAIFPCPVARSRD